MEQAGTGWWNMTKESAECDEEGPVQESLNEEEMVQKIGQNRPTGSSGMISKRLLFSSL